MPDPIEPEIPLPENDFPVENSSITESERQAARNRVALPVEDKDTDSAFPVENSGIVGEDLNVRAGLAE